MFVPDALKAVPRSRSAENSPGREASDVERFQTKNRVLPRTYPSGAQPMNYPLPGACDLRRFLSACLDTESRS